MSTNFLAIVAHKFGQIETAILALTVVGISALIVSPPKKSYFIWKISKIIARRTQIPHANSITSLVLPHFALGMGIGTLDVALVPMLASIVDNRYMNDDENVSGTSDSSYGAIYAIQQIRF